MRGVRGELGLTRVGVVREVLQLLDGRDQRDVPADHGVDQILRQTRAVLDAVDPGVEQVRKRGLTEDVCGHPGTVLVSCGDRRLQGVGRPARREVGGVAVDPVADELDPAVAALGFLDDVVDELVGLDLVGVVADVALRPGQVPTGPDDPRQVVAIVHPPGVGRRACVATEQHAGVAVGDRLLLGDVVATAPSASSPMWQCASTSPGTIQPSPIGLGVGDRAVRDVPVDDVQVLEARRRAARCR